MRNLYNVSQTREFDSKAVNELCFPSLLLMENAAQNILKSILRNFPQLKAGDSIGIVCGKGNNAGDGFALARLLLLNQYKVKILLLYPEEQFSKDALTNFRILKKLEDKAPISFNSFKDFSSLVFLESCKIIIDAILGSGFCGDLNEELSSIINRINSLNSLKVAIDIPTGLNADTGYGKAVFNADLTITLAGLKPGLLINRAVEFCGKVECENIGIDASWINSSSDIFLSSKEDFIDLFPKRKKTGNKYTSGKVLSIAGSVQYPGAADFVSFAPLRVGAGASVLTVPKSGRGFFGHHKEIVIESYDDNNKGFLTYSAVEELSERISWCDVISLGPGLGRNDETIKGIEEILKKTIKKNVVIDADALFAISQIGLRNIDLSNKILTPHFGEFLMISGFSKSEVENNPINAGIEFVRAHKCYLVLKGPGTIIFCPNQKIIINPSGNSGLAKFGTGDVLTGVISGVLSQLKIIEDSLICSLFLHGYTADLLKFDMTEYGFTSSDLLSNLPKGIQKILSPND